MVKGSEEVVVAKPSPAKGGGRKAGPAAGSSAAKGGPKAKVKQEGGARGGGGDGGGEPVVGAAAGKQSGVEAARKAQKFKVDQDVLGVFVNMMYPAKILKVRPETTKQGLPIWQYFVHWSGWAQKWDEWVDESRLHKLDDAGLKLQAEMAEEAKRAAAAKRALAGKGKRKADDGGNRGNIDHDAAEPKDKAMRVAIPNTLQRHLMEDLDMVEGMKLVSLPRSPSVEAVLDMFLKSRPSRTGEDEDFVEGLRALFDVALSRALLYRFEKPQYRLLGAQPRSARRDSAVYGTEHLLRLLVKIPQLLIDAQAPPPLLQSFQPRIQELVKFIDKNASTLLVPDYKQADTEYMERVEADAARA